MTCATWNQVYQDCKGTPFGNCLGALSTNQRPAFQALDQSEALILARFLQLKFIKDDNDRASWNEG